MYHFTATKHYAIKNKTGNTTNFIVQLLWNHFHFTGKILGKHFDKENTLPLQNEKILLFIWKLLLVLEKDYHDFTSVNIYWLIYLKLTFSSLSLEWRHFQFFSPPKTMFELLEEKKYFNKFKVITLLQTFLS